MRNWQEYWKLLGAKYEHADDHAWFAKTDFEQFWGFAIMDLFESGNLLEALAILREVVDDDRFARKSTALKRAITLIDREPRLTQWRSWIRDAVLEAGLPLRLSREQLLAFLRLYDDPMKALTEVAPAFLSQPFTQPLAILLQVVKPFASSSSQEMRDYALSVIRDVEQRSDPVLTIALKHLWN
jgi:hypothetical protein